NMARSGRPYLDHRDGAALAGPAEGDLAVARREDRVVAPEAGSRPGAEARPALPDDDHPGFDLLAVENLDAEPLGLGVAAVLRGSETLLVCHLALCLLALCRRPRSRSGRLRLVLLCLAFRSLGLLSRRARLLSADRLNLDLGEPAAVPTAAAVAGSAAVLPDQDLLAENVRGHLGRHLLALQLRVAQLRIAFAGEEQEFRVERL